MQGELDLASVGAFEGSLKEVIGDGSLLLDLSRLDFLDASGIQACILAAEELAGRGCCVYLHLDGGIVARVLGLAGIEHEPSLHVVVHPGSSALGDWAR